MSGNRGRWTAAQLAEMRHAVRVQRATDEYPCPGCEAERGVGCMTATGSTRTCPERLALVADEPRNGVRL